MLLDATGIRVDVALVKTVNTVLYLAYKYNSILKWLAACCLIGVVLDKFIGRDHGGSTNNSIATRFLMIRKLRSTRGFLLKTNVPCLVYRPFYKVKGAVFCGLSRFAPYNTNLATR